MTQSRKFTYPEMSSAIETCHAFFAYCDDFAEFASEIKSFAQNFKPQAKTYVTFTPSTSELYKDELNIINDVYRFLYVEYNDAPLTVENGKAAEQALKNIYQLDSANKDLIELIRSNTQNAIAIMRFYRKNLDAIKNVLPKLNYVVDNQITEIPAATNFTTTIQPGKNIYRLLFTAINQSEVLSARVRFTILNKLASLVETSDKQALINYLENADQNETEYARYILFTFNSIVRSTVIETVEETQDEESDNDSEDTASVENSVTISASTFSIATTVVDSPILHSQASSEISEILTDLSAPTPVLEAAPILEVAPELKPLPVPVLIPALVPSISITINSPISIENSESDSAEYVDNSPLEESPSPQPIMEYLQQIGESYQRKASCSLAQELEEAEDDLSDISYEELVSPPSANVEPSISLSLRDEIIAKLNAYLNSRGYIDSEGHVKLGFLSRHFRNSSLTLQKMQLTKDLITCISTSTSLTKITKYVASFIHTNEQFENAANKTYGCLTKSGLLKTALDIQNALATTTQKQAIKNCS